MAKTWEQIVKEMGKVPPEQSMKDEKELRMEIGEEGFWKEYQRVAMKMSEERFTRP